MQWSFLPAFISMPIGWQCSRLRPLYTRDATGILARRPSSQSATLRSALPAQLHVSTNRRCRSFTDLHPGQGFLRRGQRSCCYGDVGVRQNSVMWWRTLSAHRGRGLICDNTLCVSWIDQFWPFVSLAQVSNLGSRIPSCLRLLSHHCQHLERRHCCFIR